MEDRRVVDEDELLIRLRAVASSAPASAAALDAAEAVLGRPLPALLRRLYTDVGNGGFGPGLGVLGVAGGHAAGGGTAVEQVEHGAWPDGLWPICYWGCISYSLVGLEDGRIRGYDGNNVEIEDGALFDEGIDLAEWLQRWLAGTLHQPWVLWDERLGRWRGATDADRGAASGS